MIYCTELSFSKVTVVAASTNVCQTEYEGGFETDWYYPESGSREAYELAAEILEDDLADMGFVPTADGSTYHFDMEALENSKDEVPSKDNEAR